MKFCQEQWERENVLTFLMLKIKSDEKYLTITESKRKFNPDNGTFFYEKHKLFLYKEDFDKFQNALQGVLEFIETGVLPDESLFDQTTDNRRSDFNFEDLEA